ncbi:peptidase S41 family [Sporocytophaga myxococcoides]|uniref:Peptidase S41 family n=1 Tax=Sporocytophaga myxococcoides TaxID=153721 RepID=A0A098LEH3_9BACT|nr:S41 family peptidase [Sporocytophaga myxococcoides]GAL85306.1 peptidase S41 family [Sporocytophaga myxococcoides]
MKLIQIKYIYSFLLLIIFFSACEKALIEPNKSSSAEKNFEIFWNDINNTYPFFSYDKVDWQSVYNSNRPLVNASTTDDELFEIFKNMLRPLLDGHISLKKPNGVTWANERHYEYSSNFSSSLVRGRYLNNKVNFVTAPDYSDKNKTDTIIRYGFINNNILYFHVGTFLTNLPVRDTLRNIVNRNPQLIGVIMDMRNNGGGVLSSAQKLASYFTGTTQLYGYLKNKTGPLDNNFSDAYGLYTQGDGRGSFGTKPVAILTNRYDFSATEHFVMATKDLPNVTSIGDTTGGAFSPIIQRSLPNGIQYTVVSSITTDKHNNVFEKTGLAPEIYKTLTTTDFLAGKDPLIDAAIKNITK